MTSVELVSIRSISFRLARSVRLKLDKRREKEFREHFLLLLLGSVAGNKISGGISVAAAPSFERHARSVLTTQSDSFSQGKGTPRYFCLPLSPPACFKGARRIPRKSISKTSSQVRIHISYIPAKCHRKQKGLSYLASNTVRISDVLSFDY